MKALEVARPNLPQKPAKPAAASVPSSATSKTVAKVIEDDYEDAPPVVSKTAAGAKVVKGSKPTAGGVAGAKKVLYKLSHLISRILLICIF